MRLNRNNIIGMVALAAAIGTAAQADNRRFTFTYEATTMAPGEREYEQWVTWKTHKGNDSKYDRIDFRHELEFGVTDNFQLGLYFNLAMVGLAGGAILYDTSNVLHHFPEDRYVGAALQLFASVALLFWYVLQLFMSRD